MPILAHVIDLVENARIESMLTAHGERFLDRCFTPKEQEYCLDARGARRIERLAARFAAKEAVLKALGTGWRNGIAWTDVEVRSDPMGRPILSLANEAARLAERQGVSAWSISLTHTGTFSAASAIGIGMVP